MKREIDKIQSQLWGLHLRSCRERIRLSRKRLAEELKVNDYDIIRWEKGSIPNQEHDFFQEIAFYLGVDVEYLFPSEKLIQNTIKKIESYYKKKCVSFDNSSDFVTWIVKELDYPKDDAEIYMQSKVLSRHIQKPFDREQAIKNGMNLIAYENLFYKAQKYAFVSSNSKIKSINQFMSYQRYLGDLNIRRMNGELNERGFNKMQTMTFFESIVPEYIRDKWESEVQDGNNNTKEE